MNIEYVYVTEKSPRWHRDGFVWLYREAFGGPPYNEKYTNSEVVTDTWDPHFSNGVIVLALDGRSVVGLGCAMPMQSTKSHIRAFLDEQIKRGSLPFGLDRGWFMTELATASSHRNLGIGYELVWHRLAKALEFGADHYAMCTADSGSNSIHMYRALGALQISEAEDISQSAQVLKNLSQSTKRVYLYGSCESAMRIIQKKRSLKAQRS